MPPKLSIPPRYVRPGRPTMPLDAARLQALALHYVGRYATSRAKLAAYLRRKLDERGWEDHAAPDVEALVGSVAALGYVDDRAFAEARSGALARRGYGPRRIGQALAIAGIEDVDRPDLDADAALASALALARRKRIGPFASAPADRAARERAIAALLRGGHDLALARRIASAEPGSEVDID